MNRVTVWIPTAFLLKVFSLNEFTLSLWPFFCSMVTIALVFFMGSQLSPRQENITLHAGVFGAVLLAVNLIQLQYATTLIPDIIVSMFMLLLGFVLQYGRSMESKIRQIILGILTAIFFSVGIFAKATMIWLLPLMLGLFFYDVIRKQNARFWIMTIAAETFCVIVVLLLYQYFTGDPLHRLSVINDTLNTSVFSFQKKSMLDYANRLTWQPALVLLTHKGYGLVFAVSLFTLFNTLISFQRTNNQQLHFWACYYLSMLASFWFGTTSISYYNPLQPDPRHLIVMLPAMCLLAGYALSNVFAADDAVEKRTSHQIAGLLVISAILVGIQGAYKQSLTYLIFAALIAIQAFPSFTSAEAWKRWLHGRAAGSIMIFLLTMIPIYFITVKDWFNIPDHQTEQQIVQNYLLDLQQPVVLLTDFATAGYIQYYFQYHLPDKLKIQRWDDFDPHKQLNPEVQINLLFNTPRSLHVDEVHQKPTPKYIYRIMEMEKPDVDENGVRFYQNIASVVYAATP
ncbi:hypothetical protein JXA32_09115 [Candidatus Sumerlaeota bacterium]|nr:hypothetical protein [Candidatus Sumerlaeota bacterium]